MQRFPLRNNYGNNESAEKIGDFFAFIMNTVIYNFFMCEINSHHFVKCT